MGKISMSLVFQKTVFNGISFLWGIFSLRLSRGGSAPVCRFFGNNLPREGQFFLGESP